jgi:uncharacterized membrane protein
MKFAAAVSALVWFVVTPLAGYLAATRHWPAAWLFYWPPVLIYLLLCAVFGATLRAGHEPLISRFARIEQGTLTPELARYTRRLTLIWSVFFIVLAMLSASLARWASPATWSLFTNVFSYGLIGTLFVGEYVYRLRRFPHYHHASLWQLLRNIRRSGLR